MPVIRITTHIRAPIERCFDLARDVDLHIRSIEDSQERAVAGVTSGLIGPDQEVTWEATHFRIRQRLTSRITVFTRPTHFRDSMVRGAFQRFDHDHFFERSDELTTMTDVFDYDAPLGPVGKLADCLFLEGYMRQLLSRRADAIRMAAEELLE